MIWYIVQLKDLALSLTDGNVQVMLDEDTKRPKSFLSIESAYAWAESVGLVIDGKYLFVINRNTQEIANV